MDRLVQEPVKGRRTAQTFTAKQKIDFRKKGLRVRSRPIKEDIEGGEIDAGFFTEVLDATDSLFREFRRQVMGDGRSTPDVVSNLTGSMLAPPIGFYRFTNDHHPKIAPTVGYKCLDNKPLGGVKPGISEDLEVPRQLISVFGTKDRPSPASPVSFENQRKRSEWFLSLEMEGPEGGHRFI